MKLHFLILAFVFSSVLLVGPATAQSNDAERDILVTFNNQGARVLSTAGGAPYRNRKRYSIAAKARRDANDVRDEFSLVEVDHWPIRSLSVYCFVYRVPPGEDRSTVIARLQSDERVESVQALQEFETGTSSAVDYDDTYANLQHGLSVLDISAAHRISRGHGVRIAIIDSDADDRHEDLQGRLSKIAVFIDGEARSDAEHGTAVASVIGANANNAKGIVGVAPEASLELFVSCWAGNTSDKASCDSFTLAKALDTLLDDPPDVLNMSLTGPYDPLLARLLGTVHDAGVVIIAARPTTVTDNNHFPASLDTVIGVGNSEQRQQFPGGSKQLPNDIFAPGDQIMVAVPNNAYDFRSGSSLAAAHASGAVALLLSVSPELTFNSVLSYLRKSQDAIESGTFSINACVMLQLADPSSACQSAASEKT